MFMSRRGPRCGQKPEAATEVFSGSVVTSTAWDCSEEAFLTGQGPMNH